MASPGFEQVLAGLVLGDEPLATLAGLSDHGAALSLPDGSRVFVFRYLPGDDESFAAHLRKTAHALRAGIMILVVVGGSARVARMLKRAQPFWMIKRRIGLLHLDDGGRVWAGPHTSGLTRLARRLKAISGAPPVPEAHLRSRLEAVVDPESDSVREMAAFGRRLRQHRPWATGAIFITCALLFLLEMLWGGSHFIPTYVRMGANVFDRVWSGEWFRLTGSMFLHGGMEHFLGNMLVLIYLGGFMERLLGTARFLILYALSGLAGSITSALLSSAYVSLGASGALWGILGAGAALAFRPGGMVPAPVLVRLRRAAIINLVLNLAISFLPQVDIHAHLGGGIMGAVLLGSGWLARGSKPARMIPAVRLVSAVLALLMLAGPAWSVLAGKPWQLAGPLRWERRSLGGTRISLEVPHLVAREPQQVDRRLLGGEEFLFGRIEEDGMAIDLVISPAEDFVGDAGRFDEEFRQIVQLRRSLVPEGAARIGAIADTSLGGVRTVKEGFRFPNGIQMWRFLQLRTHHSINIEIVLWPDLPPNLRPDMHRVVTSLRLDPARE